MPLKAALVPVTLFQQNCTLIWDEATRAGAVVDPGGDLDRIEAAIAEVGITVEKILLTHGHVDHAAGAAELKEKLGGIPIEGPHVADKFLLDSLPEAAASFGMAGARAVTPDRWLDDGDIVDRRRGDLRDPALPRPFAGLGRLRRRRATPRAGGRRSVPRLRRPHRGPAAGRPRHADPVDQDQAHAAGRRLRLHLRPRAREHHRPRAPHQPVPRVTPAP